MSARRSPGAEKLTRRRFVSLLAASSAVVLVPPGTAAEAPAKAAKSAPSAEQKEFERQVANTRGALKTIREYKLPPGGDLPVVFRPLAGPRRSR